MHADGISMSCAKQTFALVLIALSSARHRLGPSLVVAVAVACSVGVLISMLSIGAGIDLMTMKNVRDDRAVVRSMGGAMAVPLSKGDIQAFESLGGIRKDGDGRPLASADAFVTVQAQRKSDNARTGVTIVGVGPTFAQVYPEIRVSSGRAFHPGMHELIAGSSARNSFRSLETGQSIFYQGVRWTVVGAFEADGGLAESWLLTDADTLRSAFNRDGYDQLTVVLESPESYERLSAAIRAAATTRVDVRREAEIRRQESRMLAGMVNFLSYFVASIMAVGATVGALNSMYAMVDSRRRDLATLRALGFASTGIALALLAEALLLAIPGALVGVLLPWAIINGNSASFVGLNFSLAVTAETATLGVLWALAIGLAGGLIPAIRAAHTPIVTGLRAL